MDLEIHKQDALNYHSQGRKGKIEVVATKPCATQWDLSLAYTPGVAEPCLEIQKVPERAFDYTAKGNLVAVVSNGTAVLGLGNIGALAGKPVMEGKGVLFKRFADIDVFDLEVGSEDPDDVIRFCQLLEPTVGGINLEDIKAPECFQIEETLRRTMSIPVFHDDQHGTAIISGAALLNALEIVGKDIAAITMVINGAGAAGIACAEHYVRLGMKRENIILCDTKGVIYEGRVEGMNPYKARFASKTSARTLADAMKGADVFSGLSGPNVVTQDMVRSMADQPIIFAMANPVPEISYTAAKEAREDVVMATGRSDFPNQVNNVLGFPFIFRGALDVRARAINEEMKIAATRALAALAKEDVPDMVLRAYGITHLHFGKDYIIPKPFDPRVLLFEASAVARAAIESGVAQVKVDIEQYREQLSRLLGRTHEVMFSVRQRAKAAPKRIVFSEGEHEKIIRASCQLTNLGIAHPVLLGRPAVIMQKAEELVLGNRVSAEIIEPARSPRLDAYAEEFYRLRERRGVTRSEARELMANSNYFGAMMVRMGDADGFVAGVSQHYPDTIRPALQIIATRPDVHKVAGLYVIVTKRDIFLFADTTVNIEVNADDLAEIALLSAEVAESFGIQPRVAMLSFSNFGSTRHPLTEKVRKATEIVKRRNPKLIVDGEMMADTAVVPELLAEYPFSSLKQKANVLVFPSLEAGNVAYKLMLRIGGAEALGPVLMGLSKPVHVLQRGSTVEEIVDIAALAVVDAQRNLNHAGEAASNASAA
jgi:malate dehydrogenase (oxaloacetate-decarboxylating)(NADP+)